MVASRHSDSAFRVVEEPAPGGDSRRVPVYNHLKPSDVQAWEHFIGAKLDDMWEPDVIGAALKYHLKFICL